MFVGSSSNIQELNSAHILSLPVYRHYLDLYKEYDEE